MTAHIGSADSAAAEGGGLRTRRLVARGQNITPQFPSWFSDKLEGKTRQKTVL